MSQASIGYESPNQMLVHVDLDDGRRITFDLRLSNDDRLDHDCNRDKELLCHASFAGIAVN